MNLKLRKLDRRFVITPSVVAIIAGAAWVILFTQLIPADAGHRRIESTPLPCTDAAVIAQLPEIDEASGLALSRRTGTVLWTHNDSGQPVLFALGLDGRLRARVAVTGATIDDWEDIASAACPQGVCLYIGDIGDNEGSRSQIAVYRVPEPAPGETSTKPADAFYGVYPDRPQDAETLVVGQDGTLFVVTKGDGSPISIYRFPSTPAPGQTARLERVATLASGAERERRITDGDLSPDGRWLALRTLRSLEFYRMADVLRGAPGAPLEFDLSALKEPQGEGLALARDGTVFLASEGRGSQGGTLARVSCKLPE